MGSNDVNGQVAWIWCIQCSDINDMTKHSKTKVVVVCDSTTGEPKHLGTGCLDKIHKPCECQPKSSNDGFIHTARSSPKYIYALTYLLPNTDECLNFAVDFDAENNSLQVLDRCNFSLNELSHTLGCLCSIQWNSYDFHPSCADDNNHALENLVMLLS